MLVYANTLQMEGGSAFEAVTRAIHGWFTEQLGYKPDYHALFEPNEWDGNQGRKNAWLKSLIANTEEPELYAWVLKHAADRVSGRQWQIEIGIKRQGERVEFSCTVETIEMSVLVTEPVTASQPRVIRYVLDNLADDTEARLAKSVPGKQLLNVGENEDSYRGLLSTIESKQRDYPIVLVSPDNAGNYLFNYRHLQQALVGLAQVVIVVPGYNSYDMERVLKKFYSAWGGAINIIQAPNRNGFSYGTYHLSDDIQEWGNTQNERVSHVLGLVTHRTNVPRLRQRIRSNGVARLAMRRRMRNERERLRNQAGGSDELIELYEEEVDQLTYQIAEDKEAQDELELAKLELQAEYDDLKKNHRTMRYNYESRITHLQQQKGQGGAVEPAFLMQIAQQLPQPSPVECLQIISCVYPDRVVVLDNAFFTAEESSYFEHGKRLLEMLKRLCTDFLDLIKEGGDEKARTVFTDNEYSANESEGTRKNKEMERARTFDYNGTSVIMWRHLKIGVADDMTKSIRVYFEWLPAEEKIVIGHCGKHLPITGHK